STNTKGSLERLQTLKKLYHLSFIAILEPFADQSNIDIVRIQLQMDHAVSNSNGKIWLFWSNEEKLGGMPYNMNKSFEFIGVIEACGLTDLGYTWLPFTWCNHRDAKARVWKRLDRSMVNDKWLDVMPQTTIENMSSVGSDHSPLLLEMVKTNKGHTKYFKFLHCWVDNVNFLNTVQQSWDKATTGDPMWKLHKKMKRLTSTLSSWSKQEYGDIFTKVWEFEETIRKSEEELMTNNTKVLRQELHQMNATYIRYLKLEESILKQKTELQWFQEGDANTKYFHALMRGRRRRLFLHKICIENEVWIQGEEQIAQASCDYYQHQLTGQNDRIDERILQFILTIITPDQNEMLQAVPTIDELRHVVFSMNPYSVAGPDGIGGKFYQACWSIIEEDLLAAVQSFFYGHIMLKFMSHACLVLLPKTVMPSRFTNLRPISLSNFTNKIISKVLSMRLATVLPILLSANQSGFVRVTWSTLVDCIELCKQDTKVTLVMWKTPPPSKYKLNTDGSALYNPGKIGGGGILRDDRGYIIYAFAIPFGEGTNDQAEVQAACYGLNWCIQHGYNNILLEVDSELLTKWLSQMSIPPWRLHSEVEGTRALDGVYQLQQDELFAELESI
ncbi:hypothetical protein MTR67_043458, partial [Solanum verrucosum]